MVNEPQIPTGNIPVRSNFRHEGGGLPVLIIHKANTMTIKALLLIAGINLIFTTQLIKQMARKKLSSPLLTMSSFELVLR